MRSKYRSAIYTHDNTQHIRSSSATAALQKEFNRPIITEVVQLFAFRLNRPEYLNYYYRDPEKPFCRNIVDPKLRELFRRFARQVDREKLAHLISGI